MLNQPVVVKGWDAAARLADLGLTSEQLVRVAQRARAEAATCTDFDARSAPGVWLWSKMLRFLREELVLGGWEMQRPRGAELTLNRELGIKILVTSGDKNTGSLVASPQPKNPQGPSFFDAVASNQPTFDFGPGYADPEVSVDPDFLETLETWIVVYRSKRSGEFFLEVSKPAQIEVNGFVQWEERIVVSVPEYDRFDFAAPDTDDDAPYRLTVERLG